MLLSEKDVGVLVKSIIRHKRETRKESAVRFAWLIGLWVSVVGGVLVYFEHPLGAVTIVMGLTTTVTGIMIPARKKTDIFAPHSAALSAETIKFLDESADEITMSILHKMRQRDANKTLRLSHLVDLLNTHFGAEEELRRVKLAADLREER